MLRRITVPTFASPLAALVAFAPSSRREVLRAYHHFAGAMPKGGSMPKSNAYVNTQATAAPIMTACNRKFDPMLFQELIQASTDPQWSGAIQAKLREDTEYMHMMLREGGGGALQIDQLIMKGLGGSDEEGMNNLKKLLMSDRKAALSVCAIQDAYSKIREARDLQQTKVAAQGGSDAFAPMRQAKAPFGGGSQ